MPITTTPILKYTPSPEPPKPHILTTLTEDQKTILTSFRQSLPPPSSPKDRLYTDTSLYCYLKADNFSLPNAKARFLKTLSWRPEYKTDSIHHTDQDIKNQAERKTNYVNGFDKQGRPIIYLKKRADKNEVLDFNAGVKLLVFCLETAIKIMPSHVHQTVIILDFTLYSQAQSVPIPVAMETINILATHYPERLARAYLVNAPFGLRLFLKVMWPFLDVATREKIHFVSTVGNGVSDDEKPKTDPLLADWVDGEMLESGYGGDLQFDYNHDEYWQQAEKCGIV